MKHHWAGPDLERLRRLNRASRSRSFSPEADVDWHSSTSTGEFRALHDAWSLFLGSRHEPAFNDDRRARFARWQQMNLMRFIALFERLAIPVIESFCTNDDPAELREYVSHLVKEELYHYVLFTRAIARMRESDPRMSEPPSWHFELFLAAAMALLRWMPVLRMRRAVFFRFLCFAEGITLVASTVASRVIRRRHSLVRRVWALHAIDEARHVAFDNLVIRHAALPRWADCMACWLTLPLCIGASLLINGNEICGARRLGVRVGYQELPALMRHTTAPFKKRVLSELLRTSVEKGAPAS